MKKFITIFLILSMFSISGFANMPVIDMSNLANAIQQLYATYEQIQSSIEQVQNTYKQIEQAAAQVVSINWDDYAGIADNFSGLAENPFELVTAVKSSYQDIEKAVNAKINQVNEIKNILNTESISFGGMDVSVAELCGSINKENIEKFISNATDVISDVADKAAKAYENRLTREERRAIRKKYGISPFEYAYYQVTNANLSELLTESNIKATTTAVKETWKKGDSVRNVLADIAEKLPEGNLKGAFELGLKYDKQISEGIDQLNIGIETVSGLISNIKSAEEADKKLQQKKKQEAEDSIKEETASAGFVEDDE